MKRRSLQVAWCAAPLHFPTSLRSRARFTCSTTVKTMSAEAPLGVANSRVKFLTACGTYDSKDAKCVLYWMNSAVRESYNHALETAAACATNRKLPLLALYVLDVTFPDWSERHFRFAAEGLRDVRKKLDQRGIPLAIMQAPDEKGVSELVGDVAKKVGAARLVTDAPMPLHRTRAWVDGAVRLCESHEIPVVSVETNVVVPIEEASQKEETAARTIRPKIHRKWQDYLVRCPKTEVEYPVKEWPEETLKEHTAWDLTVDSLPDVCRRATEVSTFFKGGYDAAMETLQDFIKNKVTHYSDGRNQPAGGFVSNMSPYLRYGHISPVETALLVKAKRSGGQSTKAGIDSFLEEMIVRRELAYNMCHFNETYDTIKVIPNYAKITLDLHAKDKRPWLYTYEELESAQTHCPFWNSAQIELVTTGKMHGYMRMYWCKKILEWVDTYQNAFDYAIKLNNVYNLDGSDPNSYAGVAWCFGKHDQGWREREIFGKVVRN